MVHCAKPDDFLMASDITKFGAGVGPEGVRKHPWRNFLDNLTSRYPDANSLNVSGQPSVSGGMNYLESNDPAQLFGARLLPQNEHQAQAQPWREIETDEASQFTTTTTSSSTTTTSTTTSTSTTSTTTSTSTTTTTTSTTTTRPPTTTTTMPPPPTTTTQPPPRP